VSKIDLSKTVKDLAKSVGKDVAEELKDYADPDKLVRFGELIAKVAKYRGLALTASTPEEADAWRKEADVVTLTMEHKLVQERIIAEAKMAAIVKKAINGAVAAFGVVVKEVATMATKGLIKGVTGGIG